MGETSRLAGSSVNGDTDIEDVANLSEKIVQVFVRHFERHVANEQGLAWSVRLSGLSQVRPFAFPVILNGYATALEDFLVARLDSLASIFYVLECDIAKSASKIVSNVRHFYNGNSGAHPLLKPR